MEARALTLAEQAIEAGAGWVQRLGPPPGVQAPGRAGCANSRPSPPTGTAGTSPKQRSIGAKSDVGSTEQMSQRQRALAAAERAVAISHDVHGEQARSAWEPQIEVVRGVEL